MTKIFDDGILEATLLPDNWVCCRWIDNKHGRLQKRLIKDLNNIEKIILSLKLKGWLTSSEVGHTAFHRLLEKFGCIPRGVLDGYKYFVKPITTEGDLHVRI